MATVTRPRTFSSPGGTFLERKLRGTDPVTGEYIVATVTTERGSFSITGEEWPSEAVYQTGNANAIVGCGQITEMIERTFPELAPFMALHLSDADSGEPMHAEANSWYRLSCADIAHDLEHRERYGYGNYHEAPEPYTEGGELRPEYVEYFIDMAARLLRCPRGMLPVTQDEDDFKLWIEKQRARWRREADSFRVWIAGGETFTSPDEISDESSFDWEGDGLTAGAELLDEPGYRDGVGPYWRYKVKVKSEGGSTYETEFGGSVADYNDGRVCAREAVFGVLVELIDAMRDPDEFRELAGEEPDDERAESIDNCIRLAEAMEDELERNAPALGR